MSSPKPNRASFFVDGFNLYHSICSVGYKLGVPPPKWLDLKGLLTDHLDLVGVGATIEDIHYYTAFAEHLTKKNPEKVRRHRAYVRALTANGIKAVNHHFTKKDTWDSYTNEKFVTHEEKETDVAIACNVLEGAALNQYDTAVLVTGDTDLRPVVLTFRKLYEDKRLLFAFPFDRKNRQLQQAVPGSFTLSAESYMNHMLPDKVRLPSKKYVHCPAEWMSEDKNEQY